MKNIFFPLLFMTILNSGAAGMPLTGPAAEILTNVAYGKDAMQHMDIYLPANRSADTTKSIIMIHGGGWNSGSRHSFTSYIDSLKRRMPGYAIFNVDYSLLTSHIVFPAQENDIKAAIDFIAIHAGTYKINTGGLILLGVSAGAHLALLQAYKHNSPRIAAVIDFFGPTDLAEMYNKPWSVMIPHLLETLIGGTPQTNAAAYRNSSAVSFINTATPPTLIFHGGQDYIVNISQSQLLHQKLQRAGIADKLVIYNSAGHGWSGATLSDSFDKIEAFLQEHLR
jgi:acetyl esterase/lipase